MVWIKKDKLQLRNARDSRIVKKDFIIAESVSSTFSFLHKEDPHNIFGRDIFAPIFQIMKIHRNHPVRISSTSSGFTRIYPLSEDNVSKKNFRFPGEVYKDKINYDVASFMMVPYEVGNTGWEVFNIENGFDSISGKEKNSYLLYTDSGLEISSPYCVSEIMPSQVLQHLHNWLYNGKKIHSHEKTFEQKLEGMVLSPDGLSGKLYNIFRDKLEERFKTYLSFKRD
jgi:hypothetical protein